MSSEKIKLADDIDFTKFVGNHEAERLCSPRQYHDEVLAAFRGEVHEKGDHLPWAKAEDRVLLRPGEVSIWAGINGHRKSMLSGMVMLFVCPTSPVVIASLEMRARSTLTRIARQALGHDDPSDMVLEALWERLHEKLWIYDRIGNVEGERLIGMIHYAAKELGVRHVMIDSLMKCGILRDDYNNQQKFVDGLTQAAKELNVHVHLVHHMRKGEREESQPGKFDVRGASEIVDLVDNLFIVHWNKAKELALEKGKEVEPGVPDLTLGVAKQRNGEWEGKFALYFHKPSLQFVGAPGNGPLEWPRRGEGPLTWGLTAESREPAESHSPSMEFQGYP